MGGGSVALTNCTLANNIAAESGGGFGTEYYGPDTLSVTIYGSTIADNYSDYGGGIQYRGTNLTLINCTVSGNETSLFRSAGGGGINGGAHLTACTVARNMASTGGGVCGDIQSQNSLFASNAGNDISGVLDSMGHNLIQDPSGCDLEGDLTGNLLGVDPRLGPLQNNGGPTWTHALLAGSPAIDAGSGAGAPAVDQRGMHRPQGLAPDIGAFEFQYATPALTRMGVRSCTNFCLSGCGLRGGSYTLQASTNLAQWFNVATNIADTNGVCEFTDSTGSRPSPCFYRALMPVPPGAVYVPAPSGILDAPLVISGTHVSQAVYTGLSGGGRAEYPFIIAKAGNYVLQAMVNAANDGVNSFFLNIDAEPQDPAMIWDIYPYTPGSGFYPRTVSWRGGGSDVANQFIPKVFPLTAGTHRLVIRGREAATFLQSIAITPYP